MSWLSGWEYRKSFTVSHADGELTDYPAKILLGESNNSTGFNISCEGLCLSNFNDVRFTTSDGETLLDYWIESLSGTTPNQTATVWVEFNTIGVGATTFYLYYGNAGAAAVSSGSDTFPFFDHFEGTSLDGAKWATYGSPTVAVSGSILTVTCNTGSVDQGFYGLTDFSTGYAMRVRLKSGHSSTSYCETFGMRRESPTVAWQWANLSYDANQGYYRNRDTSGNSAYIAMGGGWSANTYAILELFRDAAAAIWTKNDSNSTTNNSNYDSGVMHPYGYAGWFADSTLILDWCLLRQRAATEPIFGSWGDQARFSGVSQLFHRWNTRDRFSYYPSSLTDRHNRLRRCGVSLPPLLSHIWNGRVETVGIGKDYPNMPAALDGAKDGSLLLIDSGNYNFDAVDRSIDRRLILRGIGPLSDSVTFYSEGAAQIIQATSGADLIIENLSIEHTVNWMNCLYVLDSATVTANRCQFYTENANCYTVGSGDDTGHLNTALTRLSNCKITRGYAHFHHMDLALVELIKSELNNTLYTYYCAAGHTLSIDDHVTTPTEGYGPEYGDFIITNALLKFFGN